MYWTVVAKLRMDVGNGKMKKVTDRYLCEAYTATEAETKVTQALQQEGLNEFEITSCSVSRIVGLVLDGGGITTGGTTTV